MNQLFYIFTMFVFLYSCGGGGGNSSTQTQTSSTINQTSTTTSSTTTSSTTTSSTTTTLSPIPIADAGETQVVSLGSTVTLNGTKSLNATYFYWSILNKPVNSIVIIVNSNTNAPSFIVDKIGTYTIQLIINDGVVNSSPDTVDIVSATPIGGMYLTNTTLTKINSPYILTKDIQNEYNTTFLIKEGVEIYGNNFKLSTFGNLIIEGTTTDFVTLYSVNINGISKSINMSSLISINYTKLYKNSKINLFTSFYNSLTLRNSIIKDSYSTIYIWFPKVNCFIEGNIFINSGNIEVLAIDNVDMFILNNVFYKWKNTGFNNSLISNTSSYGTGKLLVHKNSFLSTDSTVLGIFGSNGSMNATSNYFGTVDINVIDSMIFDKNDDLGSGGYINYVPFLTEPDVNTPDITPYL